MAVLNHSIKQISAKLVYFGPGLCGKTTNLQWIHERVSFRAKGKLVSLNTETDRTLFFDFLPVELATIRGMRTHVQIYTVPGQVFYESTRRLVLKGADAVVFVADSQSAMLDVNVESMASLRRNLVENGLDPDLPLVIQYNKRDLPTAVPVGVLNAKLNPRNVPYHEAIAIRGIGVAETLATVVKLLLHSLSEMYRETPETAAPAPAAAAPVPLRSAPAAKSPAPSPPSAAPAPRPAAPSRPSPPPASPAEKAPLSSSPPPTASPPPRPVPPPAVAVPPPKAPAPASAPARAAQPPAAPVETRARTAQKAAPAGAPPPPVVKPGPDQWLYLRDARQHGPLALDDLVDLVLTSVPEDTPVWGPGMSGWTAAGLVPEVAEFIPPPLPLSATGRDADFPDFNTVPEMLRTALIADEDAAFRHTLGLPLAAQGFKIYEAANGDEAWTLVNRHRPWLMLADLGMPEVDGFEFCRRVRSNSLLKHRPLVFISGSDRYKDRYRALQLGADEFLSKQTPIRELLIRVQLLLTRYSDLERSDQQAGSDADAVAGALHGQIEVFGAPAVLQICSQGLLTGIFSAVARDASGDRIAVFGFREGQLISATVQELKGPEAVYAFLAWDRGQFKFVPGDPGDGAPFAQSVEHLLLEGCRRVDEARERAEQQPRA